MLEIQHDSHLNNCLMFVVGLIRVSSVKGIFGVCQFGPNMEMLFIKNSKKFLIFFLYVL